MSATFLPVDKSRDACSMRHWPGREPRRHRKRSVQALRGNIRRGQTATVGIRYLRLPLSQVGVGR